MSQLAVEKHPLIFVHHVHDHVLSLFVEFLFFIIDSCCLPAALVGLSASIVLLPSKFASQYLHLIILLSTHFFKLHHNSLVTFLPPPR